MRIPFDSLVLASVVTELQAVVGAKVQGIVSPSEDSLTISLYRGGEAHLFLTADPEFARAHLIQRRGARPPEISPFATALRRLVLDGRVATIRQRGFDRVLEIGFVSASGDFLLVGELMGKHSNLMLIDSQRRVVAAAKWVSARQSRRPILPNQPYEPPPGDTPMTAADGASPFLRKLGASPAEIEQAARQAGGFYVPGYGAYPLSVAGLGWEQVARPSISQAVEQAFAERVDAAMLDRLRLDLRTALARVQRARETALRQIAEALDLARDAGRLQAQGELILAYQGQIRAGDRELSAWDFEGNAVTLALDPELTAVENAQRLFDQARHAKDRAGDVSDQQARLQAEFDDVSAALTEVEQATRPAELEEIRARADARRWLHRTGPALEKEERPFAGHAVREALSPGGYRVLFGQNATANDYLTTKLAKPNDFWFHVRGAPSAHVVLLTGNQPQRVQPPDLLFAAALAVRNSPSRHSQFVPVDYTLKKYVRKPRGSAPGAATYVNEKTLHIDGDG